MKKINKLKQWVYDALFGMAIGFLNGFFGGGGGMVAVPMLEKFKKLPTKQAHATAIAVIFPLSLVSAIVYTTSIEFNWTVVAILAGSVTVGGIAGSLLLKRLSGKIVRIIFAVLMLSAGIYMLFK